ARAFADRALDAMAERHVPPTPHNFSVWFAHLSGAYPELSRAIEILISNKADFSPERNAELYERLIGDTRTATQLREAGERITAAVTTVMNLVQRAGTGTKRYGEALGGAAEAMDAALDQEQLKSVIGTIVSETKRMIEQNDEITGKLAEA